jgi:hypothetical protein
LTAKPQAALKPSIIFNRYADVFLRNMHIQHKQSSSQVRSLKFAFQVCVYMPI